MRGARFILKAGDFVLIKGYKKPARIFKVDHDGVIGIRFADNTECWFSSRKGYADILAGARLVNGKYIPL